MSKTLFRMISIITILVTVVLLTFSIITGRLFRNAIARQAYEKNTRELNIISDSIQDIHDNVREFAYNTMKNSSYDTFLHNESVGSSESFRVMMDLAKTIQVNPYYHSVALYSGYTGEFFSTLTSHSGEDEFMREAVANFRDMPVLTPIGRVLPYDIYYVGTTVYSYFYYETDSQNRITKAINVNMDAQWLCNHLNRLKGNGSKAYIIDRNTQTFIDGSTQIFNLDDTELEFIKNYSEDWEGEENYVINDWKKGQIVTYLWMQNPEWVLVVAEENTELQNVIDSVRNGIIILVSVMLFFGLCSAVLASRRIYRPWNELLQKISGAASRIPEHKMGKVLYDDVSVIKRSFESTSSQLEEYSVYKNSMKDLLLETYIRALLQNDAVTKSRLLEKDIAAFEQLLSGPMTIVLFRVDRWKQVRTILDGNVKACLSQLSDAMSSPDSGYKSLKWINRGMDSGEFLLLALSQEEEVPASDDEWRTRIRDLQQRFYDKTGCTISAAIGGRTVGTGELQEIARKSAVLIRHSVLFDRQCILDETALEKSSVKIKYDRSLERALLEAICAGRVQDARQVFEDALERYRQGSMHTFTLYLTQLFLNLDKQLETVDDARGSQMTGLAGNLYHKMPEFESLDDIREKFEEELQEIPLEQDSLEEKHNAVVDAVKEYIREHYSEEIVLKSIAANFKFSPGYLGTLFKDNVGMSVLEYTNEIRLEAAAQLIQNTSLNMIDIMQQTGFINESNFYKLFKKKYGVTPKVYRTSKVVLQQKQ